MQKPSLIKSLIAGAAGGALGASLAVGAMAVTGGLDLKATSYTSLLSILAAGSAACTAQALIYHKLPRNFVANAIVGLILFTAITWVVVFPQIGLAFSPKLAVVSVVANGLYSVFASFLLNQAIGLALPLVPMARRAEEFSDNPSGA